MAVQIVTGHRGENHITSDDVQGLLRGTVGDGLYVFNTGNSMEAELEGVNTLRIHDGEFVVQGVHVRIPYGQSDTVSIANGSSDHDRTDIVTIKYEKDPGTEIESVSWVYHQGESDGSMPTIQPASIVEGADEVEVPMYRIDFNRITPSVTPLFTPMPGLSQLYSLIQGQAASIASSLAYARYIPGGSAWLRFMSVGGEIYNNKTTLRFFVPYAKIPAGVSGATLIKGDYRVAGGGKIIKNTTNFAAATTTILTNENGLEVRVKNTSGFGGTNNDVVAVSGYINVRFT